ncbi:mycothiol-dependent nitroreductase Rv2466c family protein [Salinactinospora qingdaonensis]|uniref:mycothiol-dependent nitroreductase Rv2466c family protein n=1 Tax=Salinactinospora qingdaonensis TaxID=702744 RepID=UPI003CD0A58A
MPSSPPAAATRTSASVGPPLGAASPCATTSNTPYNLTGPHHCAQVGAASGHLGPVISHVPRGEAAARLWEATLTVAATPDSAPPRGRRSPTSPVEWRARSHDTPFPFSRRGRLRWWCPASARPTETALLLSVA